MLKLTASLISLTLLSGCATVLTGTSQSIQLSAMDQNDQATLNQVNCTVIDSHGVLHGVSNPGNIVVPKGQGPLQIKCDKPGYQTYTGAINSHFNPVTVLDVFFWPTFFVDMASGAFQTYPSRYSVLMSTKEA